MIRTSIQVDRYLLQYMSATNYTNGAALQPNQKGKNYEE